jgi:hypothetical protein
VRGNVLEQYQRQGLRLVLCAAVKERVGFWVGTEASEVQQPRVRVQHLRRDSPTAYGMSTVDLLALSPTILSSGKFKTRMISL